MTTTLPKAAGMYAALMLGVRTADDACELLALIWSEAQKATLQNAAPDLVYPTVAAAYAMGATGGAATEGERLAFEAWMRGHCWSLSAQWTGSGYLGDNEGPGIVCPHATRTRQLWAAWRDRAALGRL